MGVVEYGGGYGHVCVCIDERVCVRGGGMDGFCTGSDRLDGWID